VYFGIRPALAEPTFLRYKIQHFPAPREAASVKISPLTPLFFLENPGKNLLILRQRIT
jgi:hypothetical protein